MHGQCNKRTRAKNPAITCILCQAVPRGPLHFSDHTTLVGRCCLLLWLIPKAPALRKTRNQLSLNPRKTVMQILSRPLEVHHLAHGWTAKRSQVLHLLRLVGLGVEHADRYPHEFSGGQRQRLAIARALAVNPQLIIGDEPVSALDVSIQAQILNLFRELQDELNLTYLFIAHDLSVIRHISDRVAVMYVGKSVEMGAVKEIFAHPQHPYTRALLAAVPEADPRKPPPRLTLQGEVATPLDPPPGCRLYGRCPLATEVCGQVAPPLSDRGSGHFVACHNV